MNILGIANGMHETAACLLQDGRLVFAAAEERFSRLKQDSSFPVKAIQECLRHGGLQASDLDAVAFGWPSAWQSVAHDLRMQFKGQMPLSRQRLEKTLAAGVQAWRRTPERDYLRSFAAPKRGFLKLDHHLCHAASAFYASGFEESLVLVVDGRGSREASTIWRADGDGIQLLKRYDFPDSLGLFYASVTQHLGFTPLSDEWKVMGLASYGSPRFDLSEFVRCGASGYRVEGRRFMRGTDAALSDFERAFPEAARKEHEPLADVHRDFAASAQATLEAALRALLREASSLMPSRNLCLAGGVGLNCKANGELLRNGLVDRVYVQPAAGDDGTCIGAAYEAWRCLAGKPPQPMGHSYLGTAHTDEEIRATLDTFKIPFTALESAARTTAELLASGQLVGWFQGRMEFGPRALGARSILADPRLASNRDRVNAAVKFREGWRPFAPSVLHEHGADYFKNYQESPFMILSFWANDIAKARIPAVVHVDGSCRVQSVREETNPVYAELLHEFGRLTGEHCLLNTSFNLKGEPIVCTPADAIRTFYSSGLDALVIGRSLITKKYLPPT